LKQLYIGCRLSKELHTGCVCLCITSTSDKHQNTFQTVFPQFLQPVADTGWGPLAQCFASFQEQEQDSVNMASSTPAQPPETLFRQTFTTLLIQGHLENDSKMYFLIVFITDYCWRWYWFIYEASMSRSVPAIGRMTEGPPAWLKPTIRYCTSGDIQLSNISSLLKCKIRGREAHIQVWAHSQWSPVFL